jgi:hypothetical protein
LYTKITAPLSLSAPRKEADGGIRDQGSGIRNHESRINASEEEEKRVEVAGEEPCGAGCMPMEAVRQ